jgi:hypothetical protein
MKLVTILAAVLLSGCAGLNVSWVATASYNTPAVTSATLTPGAK